ncbi:MAG: hypothetical protein R2752_07410 [Vicinamibacterales bacterium]
MIEFSCAGINQVQVRKVGLGFASVLRSFLRQDEHHPGQPKSATARRRASR